MINPGEKPTAEQIRVARIKAKLTPDKAAELIYMKRRTWQYYESGKVSMHPALWELWQIKLRIAQLEKTI